MPAVEYAVGGGEKVLGVIKYNYVPDATGEGRFAKPSCLMNENQCANTRELPSVYDADCVQAAYDGHWDANYWESNCVGDVIQQSRNGNGNRKRRPGRGPE